LCPSLSSTPYALSSNMTATFVFPSGRSKGRSFRLHLPKEYNQQSTFPTVLSFHGKGDSDVWQEHITQLSESGVNINGQAVIAVYPLGSKSSDDSGELSWAGAPYSSKTSNDIGFVEDIVANLQSNLCVDKTRTYATGKSNGGGFTNLLACTPATNQLFAAFAMISGAYYPPAEPNSTTCKPGKKVPVLISHGLNDTTVPYGGKNPGKSTAEPNITIFAQDWAARNGNNISQPVTHVVNLFHGVTPTDFTIWGSNTTAGNTWFFQVDNLGHSWPSIPGFDTAGSPNNHASFNITNQELVQFLSLHTLA